MSEKEKLRDIVKAEFEVQFSDAPEKVTLTPGRINIIGEHTDYNDGLAMPAAIDRWICAAISANNQENTNIYSLIINTLKCQP